MVRPEEDRAIKRLADQEATPAKAAFASTADARPPDATWRPVPVTIALGLFAAIFYFLGTHLPQMSCGQTLAAIAVVSIPIWVAQRERALFTRRILLEGATIERNILRRLFWSGQITSALLLIMAPLWGGAMLIVASGLEPAHWIALLLALLGFLVLVPLLYRLFGIGLTPRHAGAIMRRWPLRLTLLTLTAFSLFWVDFAVVGSPDVRAMPWRELVTDTYEKTHAQFDCALAGSAAGMAQATRTLGWHFAQMIIPGQPDFDIRAAAWLLFLLPGGLLALTLSNAVCGVMALGDRPRSSARLGVRSRPRERAFSWGFFTVIALAAILTLHARSRIDSIDLHSLQNPIVALGTVLDPCRPQASTVQMQARRLESAADKGVSQARKQIDLAQAQQINDAVDRLFGNADQRVDAYLDWYFSMTGEYTRLLAAMTGGFPELMQRKLEQTVFSNNDLESGITALRESVLESTIASFSKAARDTRASLREALSKNPCLNDVIQFEPMFNVQDDIARAGTAFATGSVVATVTSAALLKKVISGTLAKIASKQSFRLAAGAAGKAAAKKGGSSLLSAGAAAAICAPSGPIALLCGAGAGALTWLGTDKIFIEIDEALHREQMRSDILATLDQTKAELRTQLHEEQLALSDYLAITVRQTVDGMFIPRRDGW